MDTSTRDCITSIMENFSLTGSFITSVFISALTDIRARKSLLEIVTGAVVCGIITLAIALMLEHFNLPKNSALFIGAIVEFVGADKLHRIALIIFLRRTGITKEDSDKK